MARLQVLEPDCQSGCKHDVLTVDLGKQAHLGSTSLTEAVLAWDEAVWAKCSDPCPVHSMHSFINAGPTVLRKLHTDCVCVRMWFKCMKNRWSLECACTLGENVLSELSSPAFWPVGWEQWIHLREELSVKEFWEKPSTFLSSYQCPLFPVSPDPISMSRTPDTEVIQCFSLQLWWGPCVTLLLVNHCL